MPQMNVNFGEIKDDLMPQGEYKIQIDKVEYRAPEGKKPFLNWTTTVLDEDWFKRKLWLSTWLTPEGMPFVKRAFKQLGVDVAGSVNIVIDDASLLMTNPPVAGMVCYATVVQKIRKDTGELQNQISSFSLQPSAGSFAAYQSEKAGGEGYDAPYQLPGGDDVIEGEEVSAEADS